MRQLIIETIPERVREDTAFRNAQRNSDRQNARIEHVKALLRVMTADTVFSLAYEPAATP